MYRDPSARPADPPLSPATLAVGAGRGGEAGDPLNQPPVFASAFRGGGDRGYSRDGNPTWAAFERAMGALEGGAAVSFSSGMAAATALVDDLAEGARVVVARSAHVEVRNLLAERFGRGRLELRIVDAADEAEVRAALAGASLLWLDALSNPTLEVPAIRPLAAAARAAGARVVVDSTLATPMLVRPLSLGADIVIHSATKHIGGHSDLLLGVAVAAAPRQAEQLRERRSLHGAVPGTMEAWLALRGLRTLPVRNDRGERTATILAERLAADERVARVRYPGLADDPAHGAATATLDGYGTLLTFTPHGGVAGADAVCEHVRVITHASSLGGVETLIERQSRWHGGDDIAPALLRLSVGCEDPDDLWRDLSSALSGVAPAAAAARISAPSP